MGRVSSSGCRPWAPKTRNSRGVPADRAAGVDAQAVAVLLEARRPSRPARSRRGRCRGPASGAPGSPRPGARWPPSTAGAARRPRPSRAALPGARRASRRRPRRGRRPPPRPPPARGWPRGRGRRAAMGERHAERVAGQEVLHALEAQPAVEAHADGSPRHAPHPAVDRLVAGERVADEAQLRDGVVDVAAGPLDGVDEIAAAPDWSFHAATAP